MIDYIYLIIIILWVAVLVGVLMKEVWILMFSGLVMLAVGIYVLTSGLVGYDNLAVTAFSFLHIGLGFYLVVRSMEDIVR